MRDQSSVMIDGQDQKSEFSLQSRIREIDEIADQFESAFRENDPPQLEQWVEQFPQLAPELFDELLGIEIELLRADGCAPRSEEYLNRFKLPSQVRSIQSAFARRDTAGGQDLKEAGQDSKQASQDSTQGISLPSGSSRAHSKQRVTIGGYTLGEQIGGGGMGLVFKAQHHQLDRTVALKLIRSGLYSSEVERSRFLIEVNAVARLDHPGIVPVFDMGSEDGQPFYTMPLVQGGTLTKNWSNRRDHRKAVDAAIQIADAVAYAHQQGVIHRDLKPDNVLLDDDGTLKLIDFGLARVDGDRSQQTETGCILGTPSYMAPEQAKGDAKNATPQTDIYAIGAILFWLVCGRPPFSGSTPFEIMGKVIDDVPSFSLNERKTIPKDVQSIIQFCLEKKPSHRYATVEHLTDDLRAFLSGRQVSANPIGIFGMAWRWYRRKPMAAIYIAGVYLILMASFLTAWAMSCIVLYAIGVRDALPENSSMAMVELFGFVFLSYLPMLLAGINTLRLKKWGIYLGLAIVGNLGVTTALSIAGYRHSLLMLEIFSSVRNEPYGRIQLFTFLFVLSAGGTGVILNALAQINRWSSTTTQAQQKED